VAGEDDALEFVRNSIGSVTTLELLILLQRDVGKAWTVSDLVRELRSSTLAVGIGLTSLKSAGLVRESDDRHYTFLPASDRLAKIVAEIKALYAVKPITVIKATMAGPNEKLRIFSDAFKLKE
jgi:hypothetical protein